MAGGVPEDTRRADGNLLSDVLDHEIWAVSNGCARPEENGSRRNRNEKMIVLLGEARIFLDGLPPVPSPSVL
jgi:hypothetical protein